MRAIFFQYPLAFDYPDLWTIRHKFWQKSQQKIFVDQVKRFRFINVDIQQNIVEFHDSEVDHDFYFKKLHDMLGIPMGWCKNSYKKCIISNRIIFSPSGVALEMCVLSACGGWGLANSIG